MVFKKLKKGQQDVVDKIVNSGLLNEKELNAFYTLFQKRVTEYKAAPQDLDLAEYMWSRLKSAADNLKKPNLNRWAGIINKIRVDDRYGYEVVRTMIEHVYNDEFWTKVIVDPATLRRNAPKLILKFKIQKTTVAPPEDLFKQAAPVSIDYESYERNRVRR